MQTRWIVAADSSRARIFEADPQWHLKEIEGFTHAQGLAANRELVSDAEGRFAAKGQREEGHVSEPAVSPTQHESELFSREVSDFLNEAALQHRYDSLYVIAPPAFLGRIRQHLNKAARQSVQEEIPKDLSKLKPRELGDYLRSAA